MSRLEPIVGTVIINDIRLGHTWFETISLYSFITKIKPKSFIEVGVHEGGLSYVFIPKLKGMLYIGIELDCGVVRPDVRQKYNDYPTAELICSDCFDSKIFDMLTTINPKIIYCDGGNKVKELQHFKSTCISGDYLLSHDFHDRISQVENVPFEDVHPEVLPEDVIHLDMDETFERVKFDGTRIVGWKKL